MRKSISIIFSSLFLLYVHSVFAEPVYSAASLRGCRLVETKFQWKNGQVLNTQEAQQKIKNADYPDRMSIVPKDAIDGFYKLNPAAVPTVTGFCLEPTLPEDLVIFYFVYNQDNHQVRTPNMKITFSSAPPSAK
ncbi:MAG: hypothetical protein JO149_05135 [Gammaproteobacteria bacterium]|nr:hypothetical protein [Gammaproteobacteria bacterium]